MGLFRRLKNTLFHREDVRLRAEEEARFHLEMKADELMQQGLDSREAQHLAKRQFGNLMRQREETVDMDIVGWLEGALRDLNFAWRRLYARPLFLFTAVTLLALGIGVNTAVFSVVDLLLLRPLPYSQPERLVVLQERPGSGSNPQRLRDWRERVPAFSHVAGTYGETVAFQMEDRMEGVLIGRLVGDMVGLLRQRLIAGRNFSAKELEGEPVALLSESGFKRYFRGSAQSVIGSRVRLGGESFEIIGVLSDAQGIGDRPVFLAPAERSILNASRRAGFLEVSARLKDGQSLESAQAQAQAAAANLALEYPETDSKLKPTLQSMQNALAEASRSQVLIVQIGSAFLMLIACANLAGLLSARALERRRESAIRVFLGAGRWHLIRLYLMESLILVALGGLAATLSASWILSLLQQTFGGQLDRMQDAVIDGRVLLFLVALSIICGVLFAVAPAWQAARVRSMEHISRYRFRNGLVVVEAALSLILLVGALQLGKSLLDLKSAPLGFTPDETLLVRVDLSWGTPSAKLHSFIKGMLEDLTALPQTRSVGLADRLPLGGGTQSGVLRIRGEEKPTPDQVGFRSVSEGYFSTLGISMLSGEWTDFSNSVVVNETLARKYLGSNPIGRYVSTDGKKWWRVSGVVRGTKSFSSESEPMPALFQHYSQQSWPMLHFVVKTRESAALVAPAIRAAVSRRDGTALLKTIEPVNSFLDSVSEGPRYQVTLAAIFAGLALLLVLTGVYGVMAGEMTQRTKEMGIRMAIGANSGDVLRLALGRGLLLAAVGASLGCGIVFALLQVLRSQVDLLQWIDPPVVLLAACVVVAGMVAAAFLPAWKASRIHPSLALRMD